jgi:hypothetical protein
VPSLFKRTEERNAIIKSLLKDLPYSVGDLVKPYSEAEQCTWGDDVVVETIASDTAQLGRDYEWPDNDSPMLIGAYSKKKDVRFFCTPSFLIPVKEVCEC